MHDRLRAQWREREERPDSPSAAVLDSQSTRSSPQSGDSGYDAGKKVKGRKRSFIVDTLGLLLAVSISAASVQDRDAADEAVVYFPWNRLRLDLWSCPSDGWWSELMPRMRGLGD